MSYMLSSTFGWSTNPKRICLRFRVIGFVPTTIQKRNFSNAMRGIGGISLVRRGYDGIRPFIRSYPKKLETLGQMFKFFCNRSKKKLPRLPGRFLGIEN